MSSRVISGCLEGRGKVRHSVSGSRPPAGCQLSTSGSTFLARRSRVTDGQTGGGAGLSRQAGSLQRKLRYLDERRLQMWLAAPMRRCRYSRSCICHCRMTKYELLRWLVNLNAVTWRRSLSNDQRVTVDRVSLQWCTVTWRSGNVNIRYILRCFCLRNIRLIVSIFSKYSFKNLLISAILQ